MPMCRNCNFNSHPCDPNMKDRVNFCSCCGFDITEQNKQTDFHQQKLKQLICSDEYIQKYTDQSCKLSKIVKE